MLRGGAFKPRTSPYSFQGLGLEGLNILCEAKAATGLPIVTELMSAEYLDVFNEKVDLIQIGARNMQNFDLLKQLGQVDRPILSETWSKRYLRRVADVCRIHYGIRLMKMLFYVSAVSVHLNPIQEIHWISRASRLSRNFHIFRSSLIQAMPVENGGWLNQWLRLLLLQEQTV